MLSKEEIRMRCVEAASVVVAGKDSHFRPSTLSDLIILLAKELEKYVLKED